MDELFEKAKNYVFRILKIRPRSKKEIEDKLKQKKYPAQVTKEIIDYLNRLGYIDDDKFAQAWINNRFSSNPRGKRFLRYELLKKGIAKDIIESKLSLINEGAETETAKKIAQAKLKKLSNEPAAKIKAKLFAYLNRRGFDTDTIIKVINELISYED